VQAQEIAAQSCGIPLIPTIPQLTMEERAKSIIFMKRKKKSILNVVFINNAGW
jgi:hypothetical protein